MDFVRFFKKFIKSKSMTLILVTAVIVVFFYIMNPNYLSSSNIVGIMTAMSMAGIVGVGMAFLLMGGGINLAAGAEGCFCAVLIAFVLSAGVPWPLAVILGLVFGMCAGLINSFFINKLNFTAFIATLGMGSVYTGLGLVITKNTNMPISNQAFWQMGSYSLFDFFPMPFVIMVFVMIIYGFILAKTRFGRSVLMCGGNRAAARLAGLSPKKISTILYMNCGMLSALSGTILAARMHHSSPNAMTSASLDAITAAVLGGVSFMGGSGSIAGVFFGALLLNVFSNGLTVLNLASYLQLVSQGVILIIALSVDFYTTRARETSLKKASMKNV